MVKFQSPITLLFTDRLLPNLVSGLIKHFRSVFVLYVIKKYALFIFCNINIGSHLAFMLVLGTSDVAILSELAGVIEVIFLFEI